MVTCPTGIDIRDGLQLECISCTQCVDACNSVMHKLGKPPGLIRYASSNWFEFGKTGHWLRPRVVAYGGLLTLLLVALVVFGRAQMVDAEVTVLRGIGAPFVEQGGQVRNQLRIKVHNRSAEAGRYRIELRGAEDSTLIAPENPLLVAAGQQATTTVFVVSSPSLFSAGRHPVEVVVTAESGFSQSVPYQLLGPFSAPHSQASPL